MREITFELMRVSKAYNISTFIIGHITKEGAIAGPRVLEHMVDVVLYFEGDATKEIRLLRGFKNRFGGTNEVGIFEMTAKGLISAKDLANRFYSWKGYFRKCFRCCNGGISCFGFRSSSFGV